MEHHSILTLSIALQFAAIVAALLLIRKTGWMLAWLLIACALGLMVVRRIIILVDLLQSDHPPSMNLSAELVALAISALLLGGIIVVWPEFDRLKKTEESLRASDATYRGILDNMLATFYRTDLEGRITIVSQSVKSMLGHPVEDLLGKPVADLYLQPNSWDELEDILRQHQGHAREFVTQMRHADGSVVLVESNASYVRDGTGKVLGIEGVARDITQRVQAEKLTTRLGRIIEDSLNEIYIFDSETMIFTLVNRGARDNLGYTMQELINLRPIDIKPEFDEAQFRRYIEPLRTGELNILTFETIHERKDHSRYSVEVHLHLARSEDPPVFVAIIRDTTARKKTEEALAQAQKMEAVGQLTGGIAHDFNNILTVILGNLELAQADLANSSVSTDNLNEAHHAATSAATLTQRLLAFSRKQPLRPAVMDVRTIIRGMDAILSRTLREDIDIEVIGTARLWKCETDPSQVENMILNLAINARDAMPEGGKLTIETSNAVLDEAFRMSHPGSKSGQYVLLAVSDTGHGMSPEIQAKAFSPFFTTKGRGYGSGLGLSMVYGFVKQSGGYIDLYSEVGEGTTIKIYLPRAYHSKVETGASESHRDHEPRGRGQYILVVEDDPKVRKLTMALLKKLDYNVLEASDGETALRVLMTHREVELLLADIVLAGPMNGAELGRKAHTEYPDLSVLYMSGYTENAIIHDGRLDVGVELLEKPFTKSELARKIHSALAPNSHKGASEASEIPSSRGFATEDPGGDLPGR